MKTVEDARAAIQEIIAATGWSANRVAIEAKLTNPTVYAILNRDTTRLHDATRDKLKALRTRVRRQGKQ